MAAMQSPTDKKALITYLTALSLFFAIAENAIPHPLPFFRLGLASIPLLLALPLLDAGGYLLLVLSKWIVSALASGTLLSPFAIMGFASSIASGLIMYLLYKTAGRFLSYYSISAAGAVVSGVIQIAVSSLILTSSVFSLLPLMMLFSVVAGIVTAFIAVRIKLPEKISIPESPKNEGRRSALIPFVFIIAVAAVCACSNIYALLLSFVLALILCSISKRRIYWHIYLITFIAIVLFSLLSPSGKVLWKFITEDALMDGIRRGLMVISLAALSQCFTAAGIPSSSYAGRIISISGRMSNVFAETKGRFQDRIHAALNCKFNDNIQFKSNNIPVFTLFCILSLIIALCVLSLLF